MKHFNAFTAKTPGNAAASMWRNTGYKAAVFLTAVLLGSLSLKAQPIWQSSLHAQGTSNSPSVGLPAGTAAGDLLVIALMFEKGSDVTTLTAPAGWTLILRTNQSSVHGMATFYRIATASETTPYTFTVNNSPKWNIGISRITGANANFPIDVSAGASGSSGNPVAPTITSTVNNALVLAFFTNKKNTNYTPPPSTTERYDVAYSGDVSSMLATYTQATAGATGTRTATPGETAEWVAQQISIFPALNTCETFSASTTFVVPAGVTQITVECWGGGGKGGTRTTNGEGGGGGGGAYARKTLTVTPLSGLNVTVGTGSTTTSAGGDSWVVNNTTVLAKGGGSVADNTTAGASGGAIAGSIGDVRFAGGNGANAASGATGGGGSSAGRAANGSNGSGATGGTAPSGGGNGGNGGPNNNTDGSAGSTPGGGGGGGDRQGAGVATGVGGAGADGQVIICYAASCTPPTFTVCPTNIITNTDAGLCTSVQTYTATASGTPAPTLDYTFSTPTGGSGAGTGSGAAFAKGVTTVTITASNGCTPDATCSFSVTVNDNENPVLTCPSPSNVSVNTSSNGTGDCTGTYTITDPLSDNCPGATWSASFSGNTNGNPSNLSNIADGSNSAAITFQNGTTTVTLNALDAASNPATACQFTVTVVDNEDPIVDCADFISVSLNASGSATIALSSLYNGITDNCTAFGDLSISAEIQRPSGGLGVDCSDITTMLNPPVQVLLTVIDEAGRADLTCLVDVFVMDDLAPVVTCPGPQTANTSDDAAGNCSTTIAGLSVSATDNCDPASALVFTYSVSGATTVGSTNSTGSPLNLSGIAFSKGVSTVNVTVADANTPTANVNNTCSFTVTVADDEAPVPVCPGPQTANTSDDAAGNCSTTIAGLSVSATDNCDPASALVFTYSVSGATTVGSTNSTGSPLNLSGIAFSKGLSTVIVSVADANTPTANVNNTCSFTVTVADNEAPVPVCPGPQTANTSDDAAGNCSTTIAGLSVSATDNCDPASALVFTYSVSGATTVGSTNSTGSPLNLSGIAFSKGVSTVNVTVADVNTPTANVNSTCSFTVTVADNEAPVPVCPGPQTANTSDDAAGNCSTTIAGLSVSATDNCDPASALTFTYSVSGATTVSSTNSTGSPLNLSGIAFSKGVSTVNVSVADANTPTANVNNTCSFTVTVADNEAPVPVCPGPQTANTSDDAAGDCSTTIAGLSVSATDNCDPASALTFTYSVSGATTVGSTNSTGSPLNLSGIAFSKGVSTVNVTVADANTPTANVNNTCSFTVTVADDEAPVPVCPGPQTANTSDDAAGNCSTTITGLQVSATDNCDPASALTFTYSVSGATTVSSTNSTGSPLNLSGIAFSKGVSTVNVTVADVNTPTANVNSTCSFTVTVADNEAPVPVCPGPQTANTSDDAAGNCSTTIAGLSVSATDNCDPASALTFTYSVSGATTVSSTNSTGSPLNLSGIAFSKGVSTVNVSVADANTPTANVNNTCSFTVTVADNEAPVPVCPGPQTANTSDDAAGDCSTTIAGLSVSATDNCDPASALTFTYSVSGATTVSSTNSTGSPLNLSSIAFSKGLSTVIVSVADANTPTANVNNTCSFTVTVADDEAPVPVCPGPQTANTSDDAAGDCSTTITGLQVSATDNCDPASALTFTYSVSGATTVGITNSTGSPLNLSSIAFSKGLSTVNVSVADANAPTANVNNTCSFTVTVADNEAPVPVCPGPQTANTSDDAAGNCSTTIAGLSVSATDNCDPASALVFTYSVSGATTVGSTNSTGSPLNLSGIAFSKGLSTVIVSVADANTPTANVNNTCSFTVTVADNEAPVPVCPGPQTANTSDDAAGDCSTTLAGLSVSATDNCDPASALVFTYSVSGATTVGITNSTGSPLNLSSIAFSKGLSTVIVSVADANTPTANVNNTCSFTVTVADDEAPVPVCPGPQTANTSDDAAGNCSTTNAGLSVSATDNCDPASALVFTYSVSGATTVGSTNSTGSPLNLSSIAFSKGLSTVIVSVADANTPTANVNNTCSFTVTVADDEAPVPVCPGPQTANTSDDAAGNCSTTIAGLSVSATDNCDPASALTFTYSVSGATTVGSTNSMGSPLNLSGIAFSKGVSTVNVTVADANTPTANVNDTCSFTVTVADDEAPVPVCPGPQTANTSDDAAGDCSTTIAGLSVSATDNCDPASALTFTYSVSGATTVGSTNSMGSPLNLSGIAFSKGVSTVNVTVADANTPTANVNNTCSFTVTVADDEAPVPVCPGPQTANTSDDAAGDCSTTITGLQVSATDNCDPASALVFTYSVSGATTVGSTNSTGSPLNLSGIAFSKGLSTVIVSVADANTPIANVNNTCSFTVTVADNEAPVPVCPSNITVSTDAGLCTAVVTYPTPGITDNCSCSVLTPISGYTAIGVFGGNSYYISNTTADFNTAQANAVTAGGNLVIIGSATESAYVAAAVTAETWIGLSDATTEGTPEWVDASTPTSLGYSNFCTHGSAQNNPGRDWVIIGQSNCAVDEWAYTNNNARLSIIEISGSSTQNCTATLQSGLASGSAFPKGVSTVVFEGTDLAGNTNTCTFTVTVNDNENPTLSCPNPDPVVTTSSNGTGDCTGTYTIGDPLSDNCPGATWSAAFSGNANGNPTNLSNIADGSGSGAITFQKGTTTVVLSATDAASNVATTCSFTVTVNDDENPTLSCPIPDPVVTTSSNGTGDCTGTYTIADPLSDNCPGASWSAAFSGNANGNPTNLSNIADGNGSGAVTFQKGVTTVVLSATDAASNVATTCSFTVTVNDDENPTLSCPSPDPVVTTSSNGTGDCTGTYTIADPLSDNCPGASWGAAFSGNANGNPANLSNIADGNGSGAVTFQKGTTTVVLSATDAASNVATTCSFTVTVNDNENPTLSCPSPDPVVTTSSNGTGDCTGTYTIADPLSDNCSGATWSAAFSGNANGNPTNLSNIADGTGSGTITFQKGTTTVVLSATDAASNVATTCSFTVTVNDDENPTLSCPSPNPVVTTSSNGTGDCTGTYTIADPLTDNCPGATWSAAFSGNANGNPGNLSNIADGSGSGAITFQKGVTTVVLSATDAASNVTTTCSFTVTVNDDENPTLSCPNPDPVVTTSSNGTGDCTGTYTIADPLTDNCPGATWSAAFSGNANGNPANLSNIADGNGSGAVTFQKGVTTVVLSATDAAINVATTCSFTVTVNDDENPTLSCPSPDPVVTMSSNGTGDCTGTYTIADPLSDNCPGATWSAAFSGNANGNPTNLSNIADGSGSGAITFQKGTTTVVLSATDAASNAATTCTFTVTVNDNENPTLSCPSPDPVVTTSSNGAGDCTGTYTIADPLSDNCSGATWSAAFSGNANGNPTNLSNIADGSGSGAITFQKGTTTVVLSATDAASNVATTCTFTVTVNDDENPVVACPSPDPVVTTSSNGTGDCTGTYTIADPLSDNCPGATWSAAFSGNANGNPTNLSNIADGTGSGAITFQKGTTTVVLSATDAASNAATTCSFTVTVNDDENPTLSCPNPDPVVTTSSNGAGDCTGTYTIADPLTDNCPSAVWSAAFSGNANGNPTNLSNIADGSGSGAITFQKGTTTVVLSATDAASNVATTCTFTVTVNDDENPTLSCPSPDPVVTTSSNGTGDCTGTYTIADPLSDNCPGATWSAAFSGNANGNPTNLSSIADGTGSGAITFQKGTTTVVLSATDAASNAATTCTFTVTVNDNENPTLSCPSPDPVVTTSSNGAGDCTGTYTIADPLSDNCSGATWSAAFSGNANGNPTNLSNIADGSGSGAITFQKGTTTVVLSATDAASNVATTCTFTVTVNDDENPTLSCPSPNPVVTTSSNGTGDCTGTYTIADPLTDNCPGATWSAAFSGNANGNPTNLSSIADGTGSGAITFQKGATTVVLSATDAASNAATTCTFTVTVNDDENPTLSCPSPDPVVTTSSNGTGDCTGTYTIADPLSDNCPGANWSAAFSGNANGNPTNLSNIADGNGSGAITFQKGVTTVVLSATDAASNAATTCSFTVTVNDNENPTLSCPSPDPVVTTSSNGTGDCTGTYTIADPLSDNCPGATWSAAFSGNANGNPTNLSSIADGTGSGAITFQKGATTVVLSATDAASNAATTCSFTVTVNDDENPTLSCPSPDPVVTTSSNGAGDCTGEYTIADPLSDNCPGATWSAAFSGNANGNPTNLSSIADGTGSGAITFQKGATTVVLSATDAASNVATTCSFTVTVNDNENPTLSCPSPDPVVTTSSNGTGDCTGTYTIADPLTDNCPGAVWNATFSGNANGNPTNLSSIADGTGSGAITFQKGATTVVLSATDAASNAATTCTFTVTVNDDENPTLSCPSPDPVVTTSSNGTGDCTGTYTIADPLSDNCPGANWSAAFSGNANGNPTNLSNIADGTGSGAVTFQKGVTTVVLSATDAASNAATTCSFTVTVNDNENPTLSCPSPDPVVTTSSNGTGDCTGEYTIADPLSDNCPGATWSAAFSGNANGNPTNLSNIADGNGSGAITFQKGVTTVVLSATDAASNAATTCTFTVTVNDNENPTLSCPSPDPVVTTSSNGTGDCTGTYTIADPLLDNCSGATWSAAFSGNANGNPTNLSNIADGNGSGAVTFQKGVTTVVLSATDAASNVATTCSFTVTVVDIEGPAFLTCPSAITICTNPVTNTAGVGAGAPGDNGYIAPASIEATASDNCGLPLVTYTLGPPTNSAGTATISGGTISLPIGATFNPGTTTVTYTVDDGSNNIASCSFTITVRRTPLPSFSQTSLSICDGGSVNLASYARDSRGVAKRYNFYEDVGGTLVFLGTVTATSGNVNFGQLRNVVPSGDPNVPVVHTYYLTAQNLFANGPDCESLGGPLTVTVNPRPAPPAVPAGISFCPGATVNVPAFSTATPPGVTQFAWSNSNTAIGLPIGGTANASAATAFSFTAASNTSGSPLSATILVQAIAGNCASNPSAFNLVLRPEPVGVPAAPAICSGQSVNHSLQASPAATFSWVAANNPNVSGESLAPQSGPAITDLLVNNSSTVQTVVYTVIPTSTDGCPGAAFTVSVSVNPLPVLTPGLSVQVCEGENASLVLTDVAGIATGFSWVQQPLPANVLQLSGAANGTGSPITGSFLVTGSTSATINYTVTPVAGGCPGAAATASIVVDPGVVNALTLNACETAVGSGVSSFDLGAALPGAVFYDASLTQIGSVYTGAATTLYAFSPIPASVCSLETIITLNVNALPSANVLPSASEICLGSDILLEGNPTGGTSPYLHNWTATLGAASVQIFDNADGTATVTGIAPGTATLLYTVSDANGCSATSSATVEVKALPQVTALVNQTPGNVPVCEGSSVSLSCTIVPVQGTSTVQWTGPGFSASVANPPSFPITNPGPNVFEVVVTDANGCSASASVTVQVDTLPFPGNPNNNGGIYCIDDLTPFNLFDILVAQAAPFVVDPSGVWTGVVAPANGNLGTIVPASLPGIGAYSFTYGVTHPDGCNVCVKAVVTIEIVDCSQPLIYARPKMLLQGPYNTGTGLMNDGLRSQGLVPLTEPYSNLGYLFTGGGGESIPVAVLNVTGPNAIVDWVVVELRSATNPGTVIFSRSALLQRDGDVVDLDGVSPVGFMGVFPGTFHVSVKHRNHLGVMTPAALNFSLYVPVPTDYTSASNPPFGGLPGASLQLSATTLLMYGGDANFNGQVQNTDEVDFWAQEVGQSGYRQSDYNMDGQVQNTDQVFIWIPNSGRGSQIPQ